LDNKKAVITKIDDEKRNLVTRILKKQVEGLDQSARAEIKKEIMDFLSDVDDVLMRYVTDFDSRDFMKSIERKTLLEIDKDVFSFDDSSDDDGSLWDAFWEGVCEGFDEMTFSVFSRSDDKQELREYINRLNNNFDPEPYLESIYKHKEEIIEIVKSALFDELINPMQEQIQEIRSTKGDKEKQLSEAKAKFVCLKEEKTEIEKQIEQINIY